MHCNLEEQACVKGGTPCRRSGERGEQFCREVSDLSSGGVLCNGQGYERMCGGDSADAVAPFHYLLMLVLVTH